MRIVCISDCHNVKNPHPLPEGDVLVCTGDLTNDGSFPSLRNFVSEFNHLKYPGFSKMIAIAGNHDWCFQRLKFLAVEKLEESGWTYLHDSGLEFGGVNFYGSPWQPEFCNWAFNLPRGERLAKVWEAIPDNTNVLLTHGPAMGILDYCGEHVGCSDLLARIKTFKPAVHVFGHIHEGYGTHEEDGVLYINASSVDGQYRPTNKPIVVDLDVNTMKVTFV